MNILVLGGTGFFGKHLVWELLHRGHEVTIATRGRTPDDFGDRVRRLIVDRTDVRQMEQVFAHKYYDVFYDDLAYCAGDIRLGDYLLLGKGEDATGGRCRNSVVSDAMEALIGAIYLDGGFANAKEFIHRFILNDIEHKQLFYDSKTILQEMVQSRQAAALSYEILREDGPDHNKSFEVCAKIGSEEIGRGVGRTKKAAEQVAAYNGILKLKAEDV